MKTKHTLGWILAGLGALFLITGLLVTVFASIPMAASNFPSGADVAPSISVWAQLADSVMDFTVKMMAVDWTPARMGIFLIIIGMVLEGSGVYVLISSSKK